MSMTDPINDAKQYIEKNANRDIKNIQSINQYVMTKVFKPIEHIIKDVNSITKEYENVKNKNSNLSRKQRDLVVLFVEQYLPILTKMMDESEEQNKTELKNDNTTNEVSTVIKDV